MCSHVFESSSHSVVQFIRELYFSLCKIVTLVAQNFVQFIVSTLLYVSTFVSWIFRGFLEHPKPQVLLKGIHMEHGN